MSSIQEKMRRDLECPITMELFVDPITVACCGKAFSRQGLVNFLDSKPNDEGKKCPLCNGDLSKFDAKSAQTNRNLMTLVEYFKTMEKEQNVVQNEANDKVGDAKQEEKQVSGMNSNEKNEKNEQQQWSVMVNRLFDPSVTREPVPFDKYLKVGQLQLCLHNSQFEISPSLFVIVADKSGSMSGRPWSQVQLALNHIMGMTYDNKMIETKLITYASNAQVVNFKNLSIMEIKQRINATSAGGGTNFKAAFNEIDRIIAGYINDYEKNKKNDNNKNVGKVLSNVGQFIFNKIGANSSSKNDSNSTSTSGSIQRSQAKPNVTVCILTDGQDTAGNKQEDMINKFRSIRTKYKNEFGNFECHTIGFSSGCDKKFLESLRSKNGTFRYAEPSDHDEALSMKLKVLFSKISESSIVPVHLRIVNRNNYKGRGGKAENKLRFYNGNSDYTNEIDIQYPIQSDSKQGNYCQWIVIGGDYDYNEDANVGVYDEGKEDEKSMFDDYLIVLDSKLDRNVQIEIKLNELNTFEDNDVLNERWIIKLMDEIANELYNLINKKYTDYSDYTFDLHCGLLQQRVNAIQSAYTSIQHKESDVNTMKTKIEYLINQIESLRKGSAVNIGKISDMRFSSQFMTLESSLMKQNNNQANNNNNGAGNSGVNQAANMLDLFDNAQRQAMAVKREYKCKYTFNNTNMNRNELQQSIMNFATDDEIGDIIDNKCKIEDLLYQDSNGNNSLHLAAYAGKFVIVGQILQMLKRGLNIDDNDDQDSKENKDNNDDNAESSQLDLNVATAGGGDDESEAEAEAKAETNEEKEEKAMSKYLEILNNDGETALTMAIKKNGFWKTMNTLLKFGAKIPSKRGKGLENYAIANGFVKTAMILRDLQSNSSEPSHDMTPEFLDCLFTKIIDKMDKNKNKNKNKSKNKNKENTFENGELWLDICLSKQMNKHVKILLNDYNVEANIDMLVNYCIPPKPDDPETPKYLTLCKLLINKYPKLVNTVTEQYHESPLFKAAERGSLPHVKYFLAKKGNIDEINYLGNTPLWIACAKCWPCIIQELIMNGANINHVNFKGNPPLYAVINRGSLKVAKIIVEMAGKRLKINNIYNKNGDTLILICCRNGQSDILKLLLNYVSFEFVNFKAEIDGFNAIFASVESDFPQCIRILHEYGIDINQKTDKNNDIIKDATPLHLACYYNRVESCKTLLKLGADPFITDINGQTPLMIAIIQSHVECVKVLRNHCQKTKNSKNLLWSEDKFGLTPLAYCCNNEQIKKLLVNPALDILMKIARRAGNGSLDKRKLNLRVLEQFSGCLGILTKSECVNIMDYDGSTPLLKSILYNNFNLAQLLLSPAMKGDAYMKNIFGNDCFVLAKWIENFKMLDLLNDYEKDDTDTDKEYKEYMDCRMKRLQDASDESWFNSFVLNISNIPSYIENIEASGIEMRMQQFVNIIKTYNSNDSNDNGGKRNGNGLAAFEAKYLSLGTGVTDDGSGNGVIHSRSIDYQSYFANTFLSHVNGGNNNNNNNNSNNEQKQNDSVSTTGTKTKQENSHLNRKKQQEQKQKQKQNEMKMEYDNILWNAKLHTFNLISSNYKNVLDFLNCENIFALNVFVNNSIFSSIINYFIIKDEILKDANDDKSNSFSLMKCIELLYDSLCMLPDYVGESFIGVNKPIDRSLFLPPCSVAVSAPSGADNGAAESKMEAKGAAVEGGEGDEGDGDEGNEAKQVEHETVFCWKHFVSASTQWKIAMNDLRTFTMKKNGKGTMFLVKTKDNKENKNNGAGVAAGGGAKYFGQYSQFAYQSEIIFLPNTQFKVTNWYKGSVICLGQPNIRENSYGIKTNDEIKEYATSEKPLIIEITQC